jgi:23S rRNA (cytosine1962-C5)-methyltransferase
MTIFPRIILRQKAIEAVKRFHPWIFSGAIAKTPPDLTEGDFVDVYSPAGDYLATGQYNNSGSIAIRVFSFQPVASIERLFLDKFQQAYNLRQQLGLTDSNITNCYRLINAEGDGLPSLIVDYYNGTAVIQAHSLGIHQQLELIVRCLQQVFGNRLKAVYDKSGATVPNLKQEGVDRYLLGTGGDREVVECGHRFLVDWEKGQKTGFFLDQRENRLLLGNYARNKKVLNTFCYSGGFSIYAMKAGAKEVHSVDSSDRAMQLMAENMALNGENQDTHRNITTDVFNFLKNSDGDYDTIVIDPPAFAKSLSARHSAVMAYRRLNAQALNRLKSGGILFTFSCSQVVTPEHFNGAVVAGAIDSGKTIRILHQLRQPADHPINIYHPEGLYLKGLVLRVD